MRWYLLALLLAALSGIPGCFMRRRGGEVSVLLMGLSALAGIGVALWVLLGHPGSILMLPAWGVLSLDAITAFFLVPILLVAAAASLYGLGYWTDHQAPALRCFLGLLAACLALLAGATHVLTFLLAWEGMALLAFLLVMTEDREPETRQAAWIYLVATHTGTLCLFGAFGLLAGANGSFSFAALPMGFAASGRGTAMFLLFLVGFGFKAGVLPFHFWLPPAHAAAPSHVSALMSGVLIKMGILGLVRLVSWVPDPPLWWGGILVLLGAVSGVIGVAMALGQHDLKRLLAYHSIENIGIILLGLGLGLVGKTSGSALLQVLGFGGALFHVLNHSLFKSLLFLAAGSVVHATGTRHLDHLGGLARRMPVTAVFFLTGAWAICGLPPLNGFASEWLIYLAAFRGLGSAHGSFSLVALLALPVIGALALACFAKAFGIVFLGEPRTSQAAAAQESPRTMLSPMGLLALACLGLGFAPMLMARPLDHLLPLLAGTTLPKLSTFANLSWLSALAIPLLLMGAILWRWARPESPGPQEDLPTWDCAYSRPTPRMQYTASSFADGLVSGLRFVLWPKAQGGHIRRIFPSPSRFHSQVPDPVLDQVAAPGLRGSVHAMAALRFLQGGDVSIYLLYVLLTLLALLLWMVV
jgi:hydrogenase-4 component B